MGWIGQFWHRLKGEVPGASRDVDSVLDTFERRQGIRFRDRGLLCRALTHRSYLGCNGGDARLSNERVEFLGDAVLELIVIEFLYDRYPDDREGTLTKKKGLLVSRDVLAICADRMKLGESVLLSAPERESGGSSRASILSDTLEAVIGAIYLDQGLEEARRFVRRRLLIRADEILQDRALSNNKSLLQELVQARHKTHPRYRICGESGPDHEKVFRVEVVIRGRVLGSGTGHNKKEAEQMAARAALAQLARDEAGERDSARNGHDPDAT